MLYLMVFIFLISVFLLCCSEKSAKVPFVANFDIDLGWMDGEGRVRVGQTTSIGSEAESRKPKANPPSH